MTKRFLGIISLISLCFLLTGCGSENYGAEMAFASSDYDNDICDETVEQEEEREPMRLTERMEKYI